jgi:dolichol-phosphate mannosyltransferase
MLPAFNEEAALGPLLDGVAAAMAEAGLAYAVVVVDDGSRDRTLAIAEERARRLPVEIVRHPVNQGLGAALRDGLTHAAARAAPGDAVVTLDADGSQPPALIPRLVRRLDEACDVVIASRWRPGSAVRGVPPLRRALSYWGGWLFRVLFPTRGVRDYTCGFRAYRTGLLQEAIAAEGAALFDQDGFQCMVDLLLKLRRRGATFAEEPLVLRYDQKRGASKMRVARTIVSTLALLIRRRLGR